jgi:hypothetical protein
MLRKIMILVSIIATSSQLLYLGRLAFTDAIPTKLDAGFDGFIVLVVLILCGIGWIVKKDKPIEK